MRRLGAGVLGALALLAAQPATAQDQGGGRSAGSDSHIQPGNTLITRPVSRARFDASAAKLFREGDTNRDGTITLAEFNTIIAARKDEVIAERFGQVDSNHDKSISSTEFAAWQHGLGSAALIEESSSALTGMVAEQLGYPAGRSDAELDMAQMIAPITATALVEANIDYDSGVTLAEFTAWEGQRFEGADTNHDSWVEIDELRLYLQKNP